MVTIIERTGIPEDDDSAKTTKPSLVLERFPYADPKDLDINIEFANEGVKRFFKKLQKEAQEIEPYKVNKERLYYLVKAPSNCSNPNKVMIKHLQVFDFTSAGEMLAILNYIVSSIGSIRELVPIFIGLVRVDDQLKFLCVEQKRKNTVLLNILDLDELGNSAVTGIISDLNSYTLEFAEKHGVELEKVKAA